MLAPFCARYASRNANPSGCADFYRDIITHFQLCGEGEIGQPTKSCESLLGIAQIFGVAVSFHSARPSAPVTQKSGQDNVLPGRGERTYLEDCCSATAAAIQLPCPGRNSRTGRLISTSVPTTTAARMNVPRPTSSTILPICGYTGTSTRDSDGSH